MSKLFVGLTTLSCAVVLVGCGDAGTITVVPAPTPTATSEAKDDTVAATQTNELEQAQSDLAKAQTELDALKAKQTDGEDLTKTKTELDKTKTELDKTKTELEKAKSELKTAKEDADLQAQKHADMTANAIARGLTPTNAIAFAKKSKELVMGSEAYTKALAEALAQQAATNPDTPNSVPNPNPSPAPAPNSPAKDEVNEFAEALKTKGFDKDGTGAMQGRMESYYSNVAEGIYKQYYNGIILTLDNKKSKEAGTLKLNQAAGTRNGSPAEDDLNVFKPNDGITVNLLQGNKDKEQPYWRELTASDFKEGTFAGKGFVGGSGADSSWRNRFSDVRYGVYTADGNTILFVNGTPASKGFNATYTGHAFYGTDGEYQVLENGVTVKVNMAKGANDGTYSMDLNTGSAGVLNFKGNVSGNTFEGKEGDGETKGGFFGNGDDMGGIFHITKEGDQKGYNGVFGASSKK